MATSAFPTTEPNASVDLDLALPAAICILVCLTRVHCVVFSDRRFV
jgi:hypothetical protein